MIPSPVPGRYKRRWPLRARTGFLSLSPPRFGYKTQQSSAWTYLSIAVGRVLRFCPRTLVRKVLVLHGTGQLLGAQEKG